MIKKILLFILVIAAVLNSSAQKSIPKPVPARLVVDNANILSASQQEILEKKLVALDDSTSNQIAIVIIKSLNDVPIEDVANATFRDWGIGNKKTNNGVLLLVAIDDRKIRIEVGTGLEGAIPDITANEIINDVIKPNFKQSNYYDGLNAAIDDLSKAAVGEYHVERDRPAASERRERSSGGGGSILFIIIIVIIVIVISGRGGGGRGGGGRGADFFTPFIIGSLLSGNDRGSSNWGGGGNSGGGGWSGGDSGGGGFGGGDSGGGGASGSW